MPSGNPNMGANETHSTTGSSGGSGSSGGGKMGSGSSQTGGVKGGTGGSSPGGSQNQSGGGKMGANSSQSGGVKGGTGGSPGGGQNQSGGKMGAGSSQSGGVKGGTGGSPASSGGGKMGSNSSQSGGTKTATGKGSANAATGPSNYGGGSAFGGFGSPGGLNPKDANSLAQLNKTDRAIVDTASALAGRYGKYGMSVPDAYQAATQYAKTAFGELGKPFSTPKNLAAVSQVMMNRLDAAYMNGQYGGSWKSALQGFDASPEAAQRKGSGLSALGNSAYNAATIGTDAMNSGLGGLLGQLQGTGPSLPGQVMNATNYATPAADAWGGFSYGPHNFSNPDPGRQPGVIASNRMAVNGGVAGLTGAVAANTSRPSVAMADMSGMGGLGGLFSGKTINDRLSPEAVSPMAGQGSLSPERAVAMSDFGTMHTASTGGVRTDRAPSQPQARDYDPLSSISLPDSRSAPVQVAQGYDPLGSVRAPGVQPQQPQPASYDPLSSVQVPQHRSDFMNYISNKLDPIDKKVGAFATSLRGYLSPLDEVGWGSLGARGASAGGPGYQKPTKKSVAPVTPTTPAESIWQLGRALYEPVNLNGVVNTDYSGIGGTIPYV